MEFDNILSLLGKTIYVIEQDIIRNQDASNTFVLNCTKQVVAEIRFPSDPYYYSLDHKERKIVFIYNMEYDDCFEFFSLDDIEKTVFFTEETAKKRIEELQKEM